MDTETRRARLIARHHLARTAADSVVAVDDLVAMHSSDPLTPHLGLWARVTGFRPEHLDAALEQRGLWRLHAMRRTLWIAPTERVGVLDAAVGADIARKERKRLAGWVAEARPRSEGWLAGLEHEVVEAVRARPRTTTRELTAQLPELSTKIQLGRGKWATEAAIGSRLLMVLAMELKLARAAPAGSWKSSQYAWFAPDAVPRSDPAEARARLVGHYLARFGPVTETDVRWWTGMTATAARKALAAAGAVQVEVDGSPAWDAPDAADEEARGVALLPGLDPTPMGYKERGWFLGGHEAALFDRNGNIGPSVWVDGRIVGGWAVDAEGQVRWRLLEAVRPDDRSAIEAEVDRLIAWLAGLSITPRFRTPLEKELSARS